jgi:hypothetical protein
MSATDLEEIVQQEEADAAAEREREQAEFDGSHTDEVDEESSAEAAGEHDQVPPAAQPVDFEASMRKLEREAKRHAKAVAGILGDDFAQLEECPACQIAGYVWPYQPFTEADQERKAAVDAYFAASLPPFKASPDTVTCEPCDGWGAVLSGAKNELHRIEQCASCNGNGWIRRAASVAPSPSAGTFGETAPGLPQPGAADLGPDAWLRPYGHRDYGIPPSMVNV